MAPYFRRLADEALAMVRNGGPFRNLNAIGPSLGLVVAPDTAGSVYMSIRSRAGGTSEFSYVVGHPCLELEEALERWAAEAPREIERYVMDSLADALLAGATHEDLVLTVANAVASTVMGT